VRRYQEPHRRYHTLRHVDDCLRRFEWIRHLAESPDAVELALWFHDAVYAQCTPDMQCSPDNERDSAEFYLVRSIGASATFRRSVCRLILITRHLAAAHGVDRGFVVDIDLGGFALPWEDFRRQGRLVRAECAWQTEAEHAVALAGFLRRLLARPRFYTTDWFHEHFEQAARANIARLLDEWRREGYLLPSA
jgi:predicted metal-dependent HD superfamily phosphohydrolase